MLVVVSRRAGGDMGEIRPPKRSETLASWMLPAMSAALDEDEQEAAAFEMLRAVEKLKK